MKMLPATVLLLGLWAFTAAHAEWEILDPVRGAADFLRIRGATKPRRRALPPIRHKRRTAPADVFWATSVKFVASRRNSSAETALLTRERTTGG
jgi:hypothetical protein